MFPLLILFFSVSVIFTWVIFQLIGKNYALDQPNSRKRHVSTIPQIGGLVFGPFFLLIGWWLELLPGWYLICGLVTILLGATDDVRHVPWQIKLTVQLALVVYIATIFWGTFNIITFYTYSIPVTQIFLLVIFLLWFIGIYNAVNLIDGLDGLAGGFMVIVCIGAALAGNGAFAQLNYVFAVLLLGFLIFNQRPAKLFMGDAGSLLLGFHTAVLPLLFVESIPANNNLNMTPFILLASYLVADTTRVFFTRLVARKSPMTADTIHLHHLILQQSGSYLSSIYSIYVITIISAIATSFSFHNVLSDNAMLGHLALMLVFILTPPVQSYVPIITRTIRPFYTWNKSNQPTPPLILRTIFVFMLLIGLIVSLCVNCELVSIIGWQHGLAVILLLVFGFLHRKDKMAMYAGQMGLTLLFAEIYWDIELGTITKLFTTLFLVSYVIFSLEKRTGCNISKFASLDLLMILIAFGNMCIFALGYPVSAWFFLPLLSVWFGLRFVLLRTLYLGL